MTITIRHLFLFFIICSTALPLSPCPPVPLSLAAAESVEQDDKPALEPAKVEFELLRSLHIAVDVKINDAGPYRLIFDLGAPITLVSGRFAAEAGMITKVAAERPAFMGMRGERVAKRFQIGDLVAEDVPVMVMDHPTIKAISEILGPIDGIVGYPFFARYKFTIDYPAKTMTFTPSDYKPQNVMNQMMGRMFASRDTKKKHISPAGLFGIEVEKSDGDDAPGITIKKVWPTSPAALAGLQSGDRLVSLDGRWTGSNTDALDAATFAKPSETIPVVIRRGEQTLQVEVQPVLGL